RTTAKRQRPGTDVPGLQSKPSRFTRSSYQSTVRLIRASRACSTEVGVGQVVLAVKTPAADTVPSSGLYPSTASEFNTLTMSMATWLRVRPNRKIFAILRSRSLARSPYSVSGARTFSAVTAAPLDRFRPSDWVIGDPGPDGKFTVALSAAPGRLENVPAT